MDILEISLWLFLVITSVSISESKSFGKYLVPKNVGTINEFDKNCFCFKQSGYHQRVPEILGRDKSNLERLVVYLYKDKITERVKMYIPHAEKQALVPDLAFEVGDKLITIGDDKKVIDIYKIYSHYQQSHLDSKEADISTPDKIHYSDNLNHEVPQYVDTDGVTIEKIDEPDDNQNPYIDHSYEKPINFDIYKVSKDIQAEVIYTDNASHNINQYVDINKIPSKEKDLPINIEYVDNNEPRVDPSIISSEDVNISGDTEHIDNNNYSDHYSHESDKVLEEITIPGETIYIGPSKPVNTPDENIYIDKNYNYDHYSSESDIQEVDTPGETINIDEHYEQPNMPNVDTNKELLKPVYVPDENIYIDNNDYFDDYPRETDVVSQEVNIPAETINIDGFDYHGQNKPHVFDNNKEPSSKSDKFIYIDTTKVTSEELKNPDEQFVDVEDHEPIYSDSNVDQPETIWYIPHESTSTDSDEHRNKYSNTDSASNEEIKLSKETSEEPQPYEVSPLPNQSKQEDGLSIEDTRESQEVHNGDNSKEDIEWTEIKKATEQYSESNEDFEYSNEIYDGDLNKENKAESYQHSQNHYKTFDRWFIQQMQRFKTYKEHDRAINLQIIERYILKILHDNDMHVTTEGVLTDFFGTALDVRNLQLRPILIGNTMAFGSILNDKATDLVMPANMAYLQAILITNSNPSMILGIIPIGKTVIPPSAANAFSTVLEPHFHSKLTQSGSQYSTSEPISSNEGRSSYKATTGYGGENKPILLHLTSNKRSPMHKTLGKTVISVVKEAPFLMQSQYNRQNSPVYETKSISGAREFVLSNDSGPVNKLILSLRGSSDPMKSEEATNTLLESMRRSSGDSEVPIEPEGSEEVSADEDDIGGRIVGGHAATSSGTPLSIKGRMKDF